jgi:predicted DNA-binding protein (UPF0251 family)
MAKTLELQNYPNLLTVSEAAEQLRISRWTMYQLIRANELKIASDDLASFINKRKEVSRET